MEPWLVIQVAAGMMIGTTIALFLIVRRIVEMQRCMEGLAMTLVSVIGKTMPVSDEPFGCTSKSKDNDGNHSVSVK